MGSRPITVRRRDAGGQWEMVSRDPHPSLAGQVRRYAGYIERTSAPQRRLEAAYAGVVLIVSFGETLRITDAAGGRGIHGCFVGGLSDAPTYTEHDGDQHGLQIDLTPLGATALLGLPMAQLTNRVVELSDVLGRGAQELVGRLHDAGSWERRFSLLDVTLARRLAQAQPPHPALMHAWSRLAETHGRIEIGELGGEVGWSRRHLATRFREELGLAPKRFARVLRFERAADLLARDDGARFADIAFDCGYCDQAHLNRDFRQFAGTSPGDYVGRLLPGGGVAADVTFVQDPSALAA